MSRILVVDDEPNFSRALRLILSREGHLVELAADGEAAVALTNEQKPDVILLDIAMPGMDGREVCRRIRESRSTARIVYVTGTAGARDAGILSELQCEADAVLAKPATKHAILAAVADALGR